ncbi:MAG: hypothetical protein CL946_10875 [Ectothiorhodospiraceae bacterium]|nr:hypothetical protein [Ectothiorhodospiraceae bacterium]
MNYILPSIKSLILLYLGSLVLYSAFVYPYEFQSANPPFLIFIMDAVNLIVHEAGHFFFKFLGRTLYLMGGTIMQILLPLGIAVFVWFKARDWVFLPLFWTGHAMINGSIYIYDARFMNLQLIREGLLHDWFYALSENNWLNAHDDIAYTVGILGFLAMVTAIAHGINTTISGFLRASRGEELPA